MTSEKPDINEWLKNKTLTVRNSELSSKSYDYLHDVLKVKGLTVKGLTVPSISEQAKNVAEIIDIYNTLLNEYERDYGNMPSSTILNGEVLFYPPDNQKALSEVLSEFSKGFEGVNFGIVTLIYNNHVESLQKILPTKEDKSEYTMDELLVGLRGTYRKNAPDIQQAFNVPSKEIISPKLSLPPSTIPSLPPKEASVINKPETNEFGGGSRRRKRKSRRRKSRKRNTKKYK